jgi:hypothetical protein
VKNSTTEQLGKDMLRTVQQMSPQEKVEARKLLDEELAAKRCRRQNGTLRAWFATRADAVAFEANPLNSAYHGDLPVLCLKPGCGGWHLSHPHWPDAQAAAKAWVN